MDLAQAIFLAVLGSLIPIVLWLLFWLREIKAHPAPKSRVFEVFLGGMTATLIALPLESAVFQIFGSPISIPFAVILIWAGIEEFLKFFACYAIALRSRDYNEPIDAVIFMIIGALGFSALENMLFLFHPLYYGSDGIGVLILGNMRFIGASLLHVLSSSIVGIFIAFSFYKTAIHKKTSIIIGLFLALIVHTLFNIFISNQTNGGSIILTFSGVWLGIIIIIIILEKIKLLQPPVVENNPKGVENV